MFREGPGNRVLSCIRSIGVTDRLLGCHSIRAYGGRLRSRVEIDIEASILDKIVVTRPCNVDTGHIQNEPFRNCLSS